MIPFFQGAAGGAPPAVGSVFGANPYSGNGGTTTITNGVNLATPGGLVWIKHRTGASVQPHVLVDSIRGSGRYLASNTNDAEVNNSGFWTYAFNSTGWAITASGSEVNNGAFTYASWSFARAARFFDVVTYTGNGSARTIAHGLGTTPGLILVKNRRDANNWAAYHRSLGATQYLTLNATTVAQSSSTIWNDTEPTSSVFSVGTAGETNTNTAGYVAYLFAHDTASDGIVQCGSYTGNGSATGPTVTLGWNPQWVMIKRTDSTGDWVMFDTARGIVAGNDPTLCANSSAAENGVLSAADYIDLTGTGFQLASSDATLNATGGTYVYACVRAA